MRLFARNRLSPTLNQILISGVSAIISTGICSNVSGPIDVDSPSVERTKKSWGTVTIVNAVGCSATGSGGTLSRLQRTSRKM